MVPWCRSLMALAGLGTLVTSCQSTDAKLSSYELIPHYPDLITIPEPTFNPVVWTKQIKIPGAPGAYNPSLVRYGEGYLLSARFDTSVEGDAPSAVDLEDHFVLVKLDEDFKPTGPVSRLYITGGGPTGTGQDPRLFWWKNQVWILVNARNQELAGTPRRMVLGRLEEDENENFSLVATKFLSYGGGPYEKNWPPFIVNNELYLLYDTDPHHVIKPDLATGECKQVVTTQAFPWERGHLRGGTPALPYGDHELMAFFHSSKRYRFLNNQWRQIYVMGAYTFSTTFPFGITRYTPKVIDAPDYYDTNNHWKIIFPAGLVLEGDYAYVAMGRNDNQVIISKISLAEVEKNLVPFHGEVISEKK